MVHQFKNNGYDIVLDVNSGAIHVVDDVTYDVIALFEDHSREEIIAQLQSRYPEQEIAEAIEETEQLKEQGDLFTEDAYEQKIFDFKKRPTVVKALCLHIAHDCNLACRYCFAEEGEYHGRSFRQHPVKYLSVWWCRSVRVKSIFPRYPPFPLFR